MWSEFPSSINPRLKYLDRYTVWDVLRGFILTGIGWYFGDGPGATAGIILGALFAEFEPGGKTIERYLVDGLTGVLGISSVSSPKISKFVDGLVVLSDDTVVGIVEVSSLDLEYASDTGKEANLRTVKQLLDEIGDEVQIHSRQQTVDLSSYSDGVRDSAVATRHYVVVKESGSSLKQNHYKVKSRCGEIQGLLNGADLQAERLTESNLKSAVKQLYLGKARFSGSTCTVSRGQNNVNRVLYVDKYPEQLPLGWIANILGAEHPGMVDVVQTVSPVSNTQRTWMDRMLARIDSELSSSKKPSRQADLRQQKHDLEDMIDLDASGDTLVNYGIYITVRGSSDAEARRTLESVQTVLDRFRVDTREPRNLGKAFKRVSAFHSGRFSRTEIVPARSAATGFCFATQDTIERSGVVYGKRRNSTPVVLDRFTWEAGHTTVMGKIGSGKTYWTKLMLLRSYRRTEDLEIYVVDPKKRDYGKLISALGGETYFVGDSYPEPETDIVRYTVEDPSKDNTEDLAETVRHVYRQAAQTDRKTLVVVDETHRIVNKGNGIHTRGLQAVSTLVRESRDRNIAVTLVTQNADEFTRSNEGRNILKNTDCNLFFRQREVDSPVSDFFPLSELQRTELRKLRTGTEVEFSEALIQGPVNSRIRVESSEEEHRVIEYGESREQAEPSENTVVEESQSDRQQSKNRKKQRTDGGNNPSKKSTDSKSEGYGYWEMVWIVSGASLGWFEYLLLAGLPVSVFLYQQEMLKPILGLNQLPLNGTLLDIIGIWVFTYVVLEPVWILVLSLDVWHAKQGN
ncbi:VirB4 family type IV secretion system protein [Halosimplex salinum]|uniref:VirB4 family type IV secretion system protein n=1 Tax=Halosimplex salinum TaxID=1710538 RepID=UPI0013DDFEEB|nr:hypothetical protein [Halosimplex salinum]